MRMRLLVLRVILPRSAARDHRPTSQDRCLLSSFSDFSGGVSFVNQVAVEILQTLNLNHFRESVPSPMCAGSTPKHLLDDVKREHRAPLICTIASGAVGLSSRSAQRNRHLRFLLECQLEQTASSHLTYSAIVPAIPGEFPVQTKRVVLCKGYVDWYLRRKAVKRMHEGLLRRL